MFMDRTAFQSKMQGGLCSRPVFSIKPAGRNSKYLSPMG